MNIYIYLSLLLLLVFLLYELITSTIKFCPIKIKEAVILSFIIMCLRIGSLLILLLADDIKYIYLVRNFIFLNIIYTPILMFLSIYIFYRNTKFNLNWIYSIFFVGAIAYIICIFIYPIEYYISMSYGYNVVFNSDLPYKVLLCVNAAGFFMGIKSFRYKHSIKWGSVMIVIASLVFIGSTVFSLKSNEYMGYLLLGDFAWLTTIYGSIITFKIKYNKDKLKRYTL